MREEQLLKEGLRLGKSDVILEIYRQYHSRVIYWITQNSGTIAEAEDVFQDALTVVYQKMQQEGFEIQHQFYTYLFSICRNLWLKRLRDDKMLRRNDGDEIENLVDVAEDVEELNLKEQIFRRKFAQLGKTCQQILRLALKGKTPQQIADTLSLKSERHATNRKSYCKQQLASLVQNDPLFKELQS